MSSFNSIFYTPWLKLITSNARRTHTPTHKEPLSLYDSSIGKPHSPTAFPLCECDEAFYSNIISRHDAPSPRAYRFAPIRHHHIYCNWRKEKMWGVDRMAGVRWTGRECYHHHQLNLWLCHRFSRGALISTTLFWGYRKSLRSSVYTTSPPPHHHRQTSYIELSTTKNQPEEENKDANFTRNEVEKEKNGFWRRKKGRKKMQ